MTGTRIAMTECKHASTCNSNVCPLDKDYLNRSHCRGESICRYLRQQHKQELSGIKTGVITTILGTPLPDILLRAKTRYSSLQSDLNKVTKRNLKETLT